MDCQASTPTPTSPQSRITDLPLPDRVRVQEVKLLSDNWYTLKTTRFDYLRSEWVTLPLIEVAGGRRGDTTWDRYFHPHAPALLERCDALLRIGGESAGADMMIKAALACGLSVHHALDRLRASERRAPA